jgi:hypothetical protein
MDKGNGKGAVKKPSRLWNRFQLSGGVGCPPPDKSTTHSKFEMWDVAGGEELAAGLTGKV